MALALTLAPITQAVAAGTERVVVARFHAPYESIVDCSAHGPYDFENAFSGRQRLSVTEVYDAEGTLVRTVLSATFSEIDTNTDSGYSLPLRGGYTQVFDWVAGTMTLTGNVAHGKSPDGGSYLLEVGRLVLTLDAREPVFVAGPHEVLEAGGVNPAICAALAG